MTHSRENNTKGMTKMDKKKMAAAVAGVFACISSQEAAACSTLPQEQAPGEPAGIFPSPNIWGQTGRQAQMQLRSMMQLRMFR